LLDCNITGLKEAKRIYYPETKKEVKANESYKMKEMVSYRKNLPPKTSKCAQTHINTQCNPDANKAKT
jgi:hypothetical protein